MSVPDTGPSASHGNTLYVRFSASTSRILIIGLMLFSLILVTLAQSPRSSRSFVDNEVPPEGGDIALYLDVVASIQAGTSYYEALAEQLSRRRYPTKSVFNWRTPLPLALAGKLRDLRLATLLLCAIGIALPLVAAAALAQEGSERRLRLATAVLLGGPLILCFDINSYVLHECWAGVLIALSICAYGLRRPSLGVLAGVLALFFRELTLLYCVVSIAVAWRKGQKRELRLWISGIACWVAWMGLHWLNVTNSRPVDGYAQSQSWIQFGGLPFLVALTQMNAYLLHLPQAAAALYLLAAVFGLAGWQSEMGRRAAATTSAYLVAFSIVGQEFNQYWGLLITPLLSFGAARFPRSIADVWKAARIFRSC